jgi:ABC-type multidrug transport system ATPase subunit
VLAGFRKPSGGTVRIDGQPVFENPRITRQVCLIRETGDTGDRDDRVRYALWTAARLRPGWDAGYADALVERFETPRHKKLRELDQLSPLFEQVVIIDKGRLVLQEETEALRARGADVTRPAEAVDSFVAGRTVLHERQLGRTKSAMIYGGLDEHHRRQARDAGLDLGPVALQDLFVHLTEPAGGPR